MTNGNYLGWNQETIVTLRGVPPTTDGTLEKKVDTPLPPKRAHAHDYKHLIDNPNVPVFKSPFYASEPEREPERQGNQGYQDKSA